MAFNNSNNNTRITILNIIKPKVRYCFTLLLVDRYLDIDIEFNNNLDNTKSLSKLLLDPNKDYIIVLLFSNKYIRVFTKPK
jgi:hypothetical protein